MEYISLGFILLATILGAYVVARIMIWIRFASFKKKEIPPTSQPAKLIDASIGFIDNVIKWVKRGLVGLIILLAIAAVMVSIWAWLQ